MNPEGWDHIKGLDLADPEFSNNDRIDILLSAAIYTIIIEPGLIKGLATEPIAQNTSLGWIILGVTDAQEKARRSISSQCTVDHELLALVKGFWQQEEMQSTAPFLTKEETECEEFFKRTHTRLSDGRYEVRLPIIDPLPDLRSTRLAALRALTQSEKRFRRDPSLRALYTEFLKTYECLGHMSQTRTTSIDTDSLRLSYLPHHGVMREASTTTKLRVVFNGSTTSDSGATLNSHLMVGPNLLPALCDVLLRWRRHRYVLATDVEKMYRQIQVHKDDRNLQRILWREDPAEDIQEYQLNTVTYGLACAPFLAIRTLKQLSEDEKTRFPLGARAVSQDVYMDDVLTGADTLDAAQALKSQLIDICSAGGFPLRKWSANNELLLEDIPPDHRLPHDSRDWRPHECHATLGLMWHPSLDCFSFGVKEVQTPLVTKRSVLSLTSRLFDPLGWLAPVVVSAKIAFQATWLQGIGWDDPLTEAATQQWRDYEAALPLLQRIRIPRWIYSLDYPLGVELHGFSDASERAYGAVIYIRGSNGSGAHRTALIAARTKVAPLKTVSLPRLELCAAALLSRLASHIKETLSLQEAPLHLWTDSTITLGWIRDHPTRWKTYVANRVSSILTTVPDAQWHHVPGRDNPADCASRGISPGELETHPLWWTGPSWLKDDSASWPGPPTGVSDLPEQRVLAHAATAATAAVAEPAELRRFSSLHRLLRVTAWCRRWLPAPRRDELGQARPCSPSPTAEDLEEARLAWIRALQAIHFTPEIRAARQGQAIPRSSSLIKLTPFYDSQGLLRVGGRLKHALLAYDERHPVILPTSSHFTWLVIDACHRRTLHGGTQLTLSLLRQRYWIPRGRAMVKKLIHRCKNCVRWQAKTPQQLMAELPEERITPSRPFLYTGVDYAGPIQLRTTKGRGYKAYKAFIAVFICMATRAVHLEAVSDYTSEAFLAAFRRFVSRRGLCSTLYSDCGTNFVGADAQLRALFLAGSAESRHTIDQLAKDSVKWRFNPPAAPHFGGIWEAAVKSLKHHLRRVLGDMSLTYEEMSTLLAEIEACLNSRPLQAISDDPEDLTALTPGHFLIGAPLTAIPEPTLLHQPISQLTRWKLLEQMRDHFWDRWSKEYVQSLMPRKKWTTEKPDFQVGRLCLIRNENTAPTRWPLARIIQTHPGDDGQIRVVTVRTAKGNLVRPIVKLVLFPKEDQETEGQLTLPLTTPQEREA